MIKKLYLKDFKFVGNKVKLIYPYGITVFISREDFYRAFGTIINNDFLTVKSEFK